LAKPDETEEAKAQRRAVMEEIVQRIRRGDEFAMLAREYSEDASAMNRGDLGYFTRGTMVKAFEDVAFSLKEGQISDIFETEFGMHLVQCVDKRPARAVSYDEAKPNIEGMLRQRALGSELQNRLQRNRAAATIVRNYETGA
jgi:parvulin-like peptidyl-prolyl isomerase